MSFGDRVRPGLAGVGNVFLLGPLTVAGIKEWRRKGEGRGRRDEGGERMKGNGAAHSREVLKKSAPVAVMMVTLSK